MEVHSVLAMDGGHLFEEEYLSRLNASQQKLVDIYIKRKQEQNAKP